MNKGKTMIKNATYNTADICKVLGCKPHQIEYLFHSGKLDREDFQQDSGVRRYTEKQFEMVKKLLEGRQDE